ncbi:MAG: DUF4007 family protein [Prochlorotrichaceae cyanobacterium]
MIKSTQLSLSPAVKSSPKAVFARHETFHPRFGWLKKGFDRAQHNPGVFLAEDATVHLGVGKNMVRSIRYWCDAFKLLENDRPTEFGEQLLGNQGWDPYLEDPASLWLLHWKLLADPCRATAWSMVFNDLNQAEFTEEDILEMLRRGRAGKLAESSFKKDVSCLLRMYARQPSAKKSLASEESLDCPFVDLGLIHLIGDSRVKRSFRFQLGHKANLPPEFIVCAALQFAVQTNETARTIPLSRLLYDPGSPGQAFKLTESALCEAIEIVSKAEETLGLDDAAGKLQFRFQGSDHLAFAEALLAQYYQANHH